MSIDYFDGASVGNGNVSNRIESITQVIGAVTILEDITYDEKGFIEQITNNYGDIIQYIYDDKDQLTRENNEVDDYTYVYVYDNYGNITYQYYYGFTTGSLGTPSNIEIYAYDSTWKDRLASVSYVQPFNQSQNYTITYYYDDYGNLTATSDDSDDSNNEAYVYEGRQLISFSQDDTTITYMYNDAGYRTQKVIDDGSTEQTIDYYLDGSKVLFETDGTYEIYYAYNVDGSLISIRYNGTTYYYVHNVLGDITHLLDSSGDIVVEYRYDAWGNIIYKTPSSTLADINPYRYRGYRYDEESSLYYLNSRYYDSSISRFINADGLLGATGDILGHNMYAYTQNNPVMYVDP